MTFTMPINSEENNGHVLIAAVVTPVRDDDNDACIERHEPQPYRSGHERWILVVFCIICTSLASGVIFGFPVLRRQLRDSGSTIAEDKFGAMYTMAAWSAQGGRVFSGLARDYFGTRIAVCSCLPVALLLCLTGSPPQSNYLVLFFEKESMIT